MVAWYQVSSMVLALLATLWYSAIYQQTRYIEEPLEQYDYIIVGAGTAGCVLAERLSKNPETRVLLIESGEEPSWITRIPFLSPLVQNGKNDWKFRTAPQSNSSLALNSREAAWPQGKMLGGTGQLNFLIHAIGTPADYDLWNVPEWDSKVMDKYFRQVQSGKGDTCPGGLQIADCNRTITHRGCAYGSLKTTQGDPRLSPIAKAFLESAKTLDYPVRNLNDWSRGRDVWGFMMSQNTISQGTRWSTYESHLKPSLERKNFHVLIRSSVSKVILKGRKCVGVEIFQQQNISAREEVILSAGAIKTPQILQLSGIGPRSLLESLKIPVVEDLPVGENLQDHLQIPLFIEITSKVSNSAAKLLSIRQLWDYLFHKEGFLSTSGIEGIATLKKTPSSKYTQGMLILFNMAFVEKNLYSQIANIKPEYFQRWFPKSANFTQEGFVLISVCLHPKSRGTVYIQTPDPQMPPVIDPRYLSHPDDVQCLIETVRQGLELVETKPFQELGARALLPEFPECPQPYTKENDAYLRCLARTIAITMYHPAGTSFMGDNSTVSVVNPRLRVKGIEGLRVMDASVMPRLTSGPSNSVIAAMAEQAADIILGFQPSPRHN